MMPLVFDRMALRALPRALIGAALLGAGLAGGGAAMAQTSASATSGAWEICTGMAGDKDARLACFDLWARQQKAGTNPAPA